MRAVLVHEPGPEIARLSPNNKTRFLFEEVPFLGGMQREHRQFVGPLRQKGVMVLYLRNLLLHVLKTVPAARNRLVHRVCASADEPALSEILSSMPPDQLVTLLFAGCTAVEADLLPPGSRSDYFLLAPIPNAYFMRNPAAVIGDQVVSCKMHHSARVRESDLVREILRSHPLFRGTRFLYGDDLDLNSIGEDRPYTVEGGDIIVLNDRAVVIGCGQRTRMETVNLLASKLVQKGLATRVYGVRIPEERTYMHLDTVFTIVAPGVVVVYPDVIDRITDVLRYEPSYVQMPDGGWTVARKVRETRLFSTILKEEFGNLEVVQTGDGDHHYAAREQATDGANVLAIAPGEVITYDRNVHTNRALRSLGIAVHEIESAELVRGLGGPRCMTLPLMRAADDAAAEEKAAFVAGAVDLGGGE